MLSPEAERTKRQLETALPPNEWRAVSSWLSTFYDYQLEWLLDWGRFSLVLKSRQIGASHTYAASAVLWGMFGDTTTVISVGEREAVEVLDKSVRHATALARMGSSWAAPSATARQVRLGSGGRVLALPSTSGGRSYSGNVLLDEFAYHKDPAMVWDGAGGTVLHGYRLRVCSTPNGVGNLWHKLWTDPRAHAGYRLHAVTIDQARADGLPIDESECWKMARGDPRVYDQLFRCSFLDNDAQYIPTEAVNACSVDDLYTFEGDYYAGLDIGRNNDLTALVVVRKLPDGRVFVQQIRTCKRTDNDAIDRMVAEAFKRFRLRRLCVDATGMGAFPAERLQKRWGRMKVEPVPFTLQSKEDMATTMYSHFVDERVSIPRSDEVLQDNCDPGCATLLRDHICSIRRIITSAGNVRYDAPQGPDGHADLAWSLALALHGCSRPGARRTVITDGSYDASEYPQPA